MLLMIAVSDGRVLNWGERPWANEPDPATVTVLDWTDVLPLSPRDYRLVKGALVLDPLPPDPAIAETEAAKARLRQRYAAAKARLDDIAVNGGSYTAGQVRTAVVDVAGYLGDVLPILKSLAT